MNFQSIPPLENTDFYLDLAIKKAHEKAKQIRDDVKTRDKFKKSERIEKTKVETITEVLEKKFENILNSFPSLEQLPTFYLELIKITLDYQKFKKSLGALAWVKNQIFLLQSKTISDMRKAQEVTTLNALRRSFYGRVSSLLKQIKKEVEYLEQCRKTMKKFPHIKTSLKTVCIVGFPNVGKTTLLFKLTGSKPEINDYAFTTKGLNVGYMDIEEETKKNKEEKINKKENENNSKKGKKKRLIQFIDTPGTLNRFNKMNTIEKQAYLAQQEVADMLIYVFDLTESSYPLKQQETLFEQTKQFGKDILVYLSKTDLLKDEKIKKFKHNFLNLEQLKKHFY